MSFKIGMICHWTVQKKWRNKNSGAFVTSTGLGLTKARIGGDLERKEMFYINVYNMMANEMNETS